jgi:hypothetical protein
MRSNRNETIGSIPHVLHFQNPGVQAHHRTGPASGLKTLVESQTVLTFGE